MGQLNNPYNLFNSLIRFFLRSLANGQRMLPILQPDDALCFLKTTPAKIKVNDLVIVKKRNQLICHRVIYKTQKYLITKGDNNLKSDGKIYSHQIIAKVIKIKRNG